MHGLGEAQDQVEGSAQLVADGGSELGLQAAGFLGLIAGFGQLVVGAFQEGIRIAQRVVEPAQLLPAGQEFALQPHGRLLSLQGLMHQSVEEIDRQVQRQRGQPQGGDHGARRAGEEGKGQRSQHPYATPGEHARDADYARGQVVTHGVGPEGQGSHQARRER